MNRSDESHVFSRYRDPRFGLEAVKILPGEFYACDMPEVIVTVLGSCVSVCLYESRLQIGGMNHFMLPVNADKDKVDDTARYGDVAMDWLINELIRFGGNKKYMSAKVFGGGCVNHSMTNIGQKNMDFVRQYCKSAGIPVTKQDLGGHRARKVYFIPKLNRVYVKSIVKLHNQTINQRELVYRQKLKNLNLG